jgi:hypothetical protein
MRVKLSNDWLKDSLGLLADRPNTSSGNTYLLCTTLQLGNLHADINAIFLGYFPDLQRVQQRQLCVRLATHNAHPYVPTSMMRLSSSSSGFSKSRVVMFCARSVAGPKRDRMVSSHSRPTTEAFSADFAPALKTLLQATLLAGRLLLLTEHLRALRWPVSRAMADASKANAS